MNLYINPTNGETKQEWLMARASDWKGTFNDGESIKTFQDREKVIVVCLVQNLVFDAAAIAYDDGEFRVFSDLRDKRPKRWFLLPIDKLLDSSGIDAADLKYYGIKVS